MKCAYYEVTSTEAEKKTRILEFTQQMEVDGSLVSFFVDVVPVFDLPRAQRTGLDALIAAAKKKQFDTLVIPSYENLKMDEHAAMVTLLQLREMGITIALEQPRHIVYDGNIIHDINKLQIDYLLSLLETPGIAEGNCFVDDRFEPPFVYLPGDYPVRATPDGERNFREVLLSDPEEDLCLYRRDRDAWFYISGQLKEELARIYRLKHTRP